MKFSILVCSLATASAFSMGRGTAFVPSCCPTTTNTRAAMVNPAAPLSLRSIKSTSPLFMESDFESAMPEKPELTLLQQMQESATTFIVDIESKLGEGVDSPTCLEELKMARDDNADVPVLTAKIYEVMIEQGMLYDQDPETGELTLTDFDIPNNLEVPEVKKEFAYLYKYGMTLIARGVVDIDTVKGIVKKGLIERTNLTPEEFDAWLGY